MIERSIFRTAGVTTEQVVFAGRCRLIAVRPELTTTGTITLRNGAAGGSDVKAVCAIGLTQAGKDFDGAVFPAGLTVQLSVASDLSGIVYEPF